MNTNLDFGPTIRGFAAGQKLFNRFTLRKQLGRGGMGVVWLAADQHLGREVALKFLPPTITADQFALDDLKRETLKGLQLNHHHIVRIYDFIQHEHDAWAGISMEYIDGETLSNMRLEKPARVFEAEELKPWVGQLCEALEYAHTKARLVHRDLKPANLMVNAAGELKVADFGISGSISESLSRVSMRPSTGGTLVYMSPQQLDGETPRVTDDIYSLGATLYDLLTSKPPFYQGNIDRQIREKSQALLSQRRGELGISAKQIPSQWEETIAACLAKDPTQRPQSAGEVAERLGIVEPSGVRANSHSKSKAREEESGSPVFRARIALMVAAVILAISGVAVFLWYPRPQPHARTEKTAAQPAMSPAAIPAATAPPAPVEALLTVTTRPPGAVLTVDGSEVGATPISGLKLTPGSHDISLSRVGFEPVQKNVEAVSGQTLEIPEITLLRSTGILQVNSDPNAQDYTVELIESPVTGESLGSTGVQGRLAGLTPATLKNVPTGVYRVTITRTGHRPQVQSVTVSRGQSATAKTEFGPDTLEQARTAAKPATTPRTTTASIVEGALEESDMPGFLKTKLHGKDATFNGGVAQNGKQYYAISLPYHEAVYEATADNMNEIASDQIAMPFALEKLRDKDLALKLAIRYLETEIARQGREYVQQRLLDSYYEQTSLEANAMKKLGLTISTKKKPKATP